LDFGILFLLGAKGAGVGSDVVLMLVVAMMFKILICTYLFDGLHHISQSLCFRHCAGFGRNDRLYDGNRLNFCLCHGD